MSVSIKDVARTANCSIKTVSRVINDEPNVTDETRVHVLAAIRSVGYSPNLSARRLVQNKSHMVCILLYPGENQSASAILSKMVDISNDENYEVLIQPYFPGNRRSQNKLIELITAHHVDGFVTTPPCDSDEFVSDLFTTYKVPQVQIDPIHHNESIPSVCGDDFKGAYSITEHLIQLGHKHIAFLRGPRNLRSSFDRLAGYRAALEHYDVLIDPGWIENSEFTFDGGTQRQHCFWSRKLVRLQSLPEMTKQLMERCMPSMNMVCASLSRSPFVDMRIIPFRNSSGLVLRPYTNPWN